MARMPTAYQGRPGWRAHGRSGIELAKPHSFSRKAVEVGRVDELLPIEPYISIPQIVCQDEDDIRLLFLTKQYGRHIQRELQY